MWEFLLAHEPKICRLRTCLFIDLLSIFIENCRRVGCEHTIGEILTEQGPWFPDTDCLCDGVVPLEMPVQ